MVEKKKTRNDEDLFRASTMTFGEHLEALRACLFKSVIGLLVGVLIGLSIGGWVVKFIQTPLSNALATYYQKKSYDRAVEALEEFKDKSDRPAAWTPEQMEDLVYKRRLLPELVWVDPAEVLRQAEQVLPQLFLMRSKQQGAGESVPAKEVGPELEDIAPVPPVDPNNGQVAEGRLMRVFLFRPMKDDPRIHVKSLNAQEAFMIYMKAALLVGLLIASPYIFYQIWSFVAAGLYVHERRYVHIYLPFSLFLFLSGAALAFFFVFEPVLQFLFRFNRWMGIDPDPRINEWLGFFLLLPLGFGIGFQLPLVMLFMERIGVFTIRGYLTHWRIAILAIFILAAILCTDPYSMSMLAIPLSLLYFGGILLCKFMPRMRKAATDSGEQGIAE